MMGDRLKIFHFSVPLPADRKDPEFPKCPKCCAAFFLSGAPGGQGNLGEQDLLLPTHSGSGASSRLAASTSVANPAGTVATPSFVQQLMELTKLHQSGALTADEFQAAKAMLLQL